MQSLDGWGCHSRCGGQTGRVSVAVENEFNLGLTDFQMPVGHPGGQRCIQC